mgnify:CR=1 FL=1
MIHCTQVVKNKWKLRVRFSLENKTNAYYAAVVVKRKWKLRVRFSLENKTNLRYAAVPNRFATSRLTPFLE